MNVFNRHIINQLLFVNDGVSVNFWENSFCIKNGEYSYTEEQFYYTENFEIHEIQLLNKIVQNPETIKDIEKIPIVKLWYLITHEKYFNENLILDKYGRIGIENLKKEFLSILELPVSDILKNELNRRIGLECFNNPSINFTCDFDHLNIWDVWNLKDFIREVIYSIKDLNFIKLVQTINSFFFSRIFRKSNYFLNDKMFLFDDRIKNTGFFIASEKNGFDGKFDYKNKQVLNYISELKSKNVNIGLHTSFYTYDDSNSIYTQQSIFQGIFQEKPVLNRHHYLRFIFPNYLNVLEKIDIQEDYSLYFPENMLFRCGTSSSFIPWNEKDERPFKIKIYPITIMDGTFTDYLNCSFTQAKKLTIQKLDLCFNYSSDITLLWHNRSTYKNSNIKNNYHTELIAFIKEYISNNRVITSVPPSRDN